MTDPASVAAAVAATSGVAILVNNAGSSTRASLLTGDLPDIRPEMDTDFFGTLAVTRAFAPQLTGHDQSAVLNVLSVLSWISIPRSDAYCAAKSAEWSLTNALRLELEPKGTRVTALHVGYMNTGPRCGVRYELPRRPQPGPGPLRTAQSPIGGAAVVTVQVDDIIVPAIGSSAGVALAAWPVEEPLRIGT